MPETKPTVYLLYGDDEFAINEILQRLRQMLGDPTTADMNTQLFSGKVFDLGELEQACSTVPFLTQRRLVILEDADYLRRSPNWAQEGEDRFLRLLENVPETTALVLIDRADIRSSKKMENYQQNSPLFKWAVAHPQKTYLRKCISPRDGAFIHWLSKRCHALGGEIHPTAAHLLAELVAEDPFIANQELIKLLDYVDCQRPISTDDIEQLTPFHGQSSIFDMVDAIGQRRGQEALQFLRRILEQDDPRYAFIMIIRQFRLLIQAREVMDAGDDPRQKLKLHPYVVKKISVQARNFSLSDLERIYRQLLEIDVAAKTGQAFVEVELDRLIAELAA
jgi:DNA polymerase-3 subunit delta